MTEQESVAPSEATEEAIAPVGAEKQKTEGQVEAQPAEADAEETTDEKSEALKRRERRKALEQRLVSEAEEAKKEAEAYRKRLERIKAASSGESQPTESEFPDPIEYAAASALWRKSQKDADRDARDLEETVAEYEGKAQRLEQQRQAQLAEAFVEQRTEARERYSDFEDVFAKAFIPTHVARIVIESDQAADISYHLGKHPALARQIAQMAPLAAAREIGRIEAQISLPRPKTETSAPDPISPVRGKSAGSRDPEKMTYEEFKAARMAGTLK